MTSELYTQLSSLTIQPSEYAHGIVPVLPVDGRPAPVFQTRSHRAQWLSSYHANVTMCTSRVAIASGRVNYSRIQLPPTPHSSQLFSIKGVW